MLDKILLYDYCLSAYFAGRKRQDRYRVGAWLIFAMKYFYLLMMLTMFVLSKIDYTIPYWGLLLILLIVVHISNNLTEKWVDRRFNKMLVEQRYKKLSGKKAKAYVSLLFFAFMFASFFVVAVLTLEGYSLR